MASINTTFIIGAQRSGTTYLYYMLDKHPELYMAKPFRPEPKFFLNENEIIKGRNYYLNKFYKLRKEGQILVEKSTSYIESIGAGQQIKEMFPDAKILVCLRNPVERAISNYFFSKNNGLETRTLEDVFLHQKRPKNLHVSPSVSPFAYLERGEYVKYLRKYYEIFDDENVGVFIFEEFINNHEGLNKILSYIGVEDFFVLPTESSNKINKSKKKLVSADVRSVIEKHYISFNIELEKLLNRDLSIWRK